MAWSERHGNVFRGKYRDADGKQRYAPGTAKSQLAAERLGQAEENKIREGTWIDPKAGTELFSTYFNERWLPYRISGLNNTETYRSHYNASLGPAPVHRAGIDRPVVAGCKD